MANLHAIGALTDVNVPTTVETVIAQTNTFTVNQVGDFAQGVLVQANVVITPGTSATALVFRFRVGSLTGALVGEAITLPCTAGVLQAPCLAVVDSAVRQAVGTSYVLTCSQTAGAANGVVANSVLVAESASAFE